MAISCIVMKLIVYVCYVSEKYCLSKMTFIEKLWECQRQKQDASPIFAGFGVINWKTLTTPLVQLSEKESIALVINWMVVMRKPKRKWTMQLRLRDEISNAVYAVWLKKNKSRKIKMVKIKCLKSVNKLYDWLPNTTYKDLTRPEIANSIRRADIA